MYFPLRPLLTSTWIKKQNKMSYLEYMINIHHLNKCWQYMDLTLSKKKALSGKNSTHLLIYFLQVYDKGPDLYLKSSLVIMILLEYIDSFSIMWCHCIFETQKSVENGFLLQISQKNETRKYIICTKLRRESHAQKLIKIKPRVWPFSPFPRPGFPPLSSLLVGAGGRQSFIARRT